jgi:hypothetical protein
MSRTAARRRSDSAAVDLPGRGGRVVCEIDSTTSARVPDAFTRLVLPVPEAALTMKRIQLIVLSVEC